MGFVVCTLILVFTVKNLNPPELEYQINSVNEVECIDYNLSGISYNSEADTFFVISNYPEQIAEITAEGICIRSYALENFEDTEDIFYLGENQFLLVQEKRQSLDLIELKGGTIDHLQSFTFEMDNKRNRGLEGVTYDPQTLDIHLVTEIPQKILKISDWQPMRPFADITTVNAFWASRIMDDYSAITNVSDGLLLLSHESNRLLKLDYNGNVIAGFDLIDESQTSQTFVQAEGVAQDQYNNIYIVSEPNHLHVYKQKPATGAGFLAFAE